LIYEHVCHEASNCSMAGTLAFARVEESKAAGADARQGNK
jgi:hypothetical protein